MSGYISEFLVTGQRTPRLLHLIIHLNKYVLFFPRTARRLSEIRLIVLYPVYAP